MASLRVLDLLKHVFYWRIPIVILFILICGLLITFSSKKGMKILGIWAILEAVTTALGNISLFVQYLYYQKIITSDFYTKGPYNTIITTAGIISFFLGITSNILIWLYAKRNYGTKKAPIIVILSLIIGSIIARIIITVSFRDHEQLNMLLKALTISQAAFGIAITIIYLVIFFKNRSIERNVPKLWTFYLYGLITSIICIPLDIKANIDYNNDNFIAFYMLICISLSIITMCFYTYFAISAYKREEIQAWN